MSTPMKLMSMKQRDEESLQDYVKRFHATMLNTKNLEDQWDINAFIMRVQNEHVQFSFTDNRLQSLVDLYERTHKFAEAEEIKRVAHNPFQRDGR